MRICSDFVLDVLIVVYAPGVYLSEVKVNYCCFSLWTNYYFIIESIDAFCCVNNAVVYKALFWLKKRVAKLFTKYLL